MTGVEGVTGCSVPELVLEIGGLGVFGSIMTGVEGVVSATLCEDDVLPEVMRDHEVTGVESFSVSGEGEPLLEL